MEVTKEFNFEMAHMLENHPGLCKNLHGHSYKLFVTLKGPIDNDMVIDFKNLKEIITEIIVEPLDHCFAFNNNTKDEFEQDLINVVKKHDKKYFSFPFRTTCENMSKWIFEKLQRILNGTTLEVSKIKLYETATSYCEYKGE